jgi:hypothetical protein
MFGCRIDNMSSAQYCHLSEPCYPAIQARSMGQCGPPILAFSTNTAELHCSCFVTHTTQHCHQLISDRSLASFRLGAPDCLAAGTPIMQASKSIACGRVAAQSSLLHRPFSNSRSAGTARYQVSQSQQQPVCQHHEDHDVIHYTVQHIQHGAIAAARIACVGAACVALAFSAVQPAEAAGRKAPPITESAGRCDVKSLDKFADVSGTNSGATLSC